MGIESLKDCQIEDNIRRYRKAGLDVGGHYSLAELLLEQRRRKPAAFPTVEVARRIIELSRASPDSRASYLDLWQSFRPNQPWVGHGSLRQVADSLYRVVAYCVQHDLPILTVLVVPNGTRRLTPKAIQNIYEEARELGVSVGPDPHRFIEDQAEKALTVASSSLPPE